MKRSLRIKVFIVLITFLWLPSQLLLAQQPEMHYSPDSLIAHVWTGMMNPVPFTISNTGTANLFFEFPDYGDQPAFAPMNYCAATATACDEYIGRVQINSLDKSSGCEHYADFTSFNTELLQGGTFPVIVTNGGSAYSSDVVYVWIDYNHNEVFEGTELTTLATLGGGSSFAGNIVLPLDALTGPTVMRVRMSYSMAADPCGTQTYGEVEDYQVVIRNLSFITNIIPFAGFIEPGDTEVVVADFSATGPVYSNEGIYHNSLVMNTNDSSQLQVQIPAKMIVGCAATIEGNVTDMFTGFPIVGATVSTGTYMGTSVTDGSGHYSLYADTGAVYSISFTKVGYSTLTIPGISITGCEIYTINAEMLPFPAAPPCASAVVSDDDTYCTVTWCQPIGENELLYDDGIAENFTAWQLSGNINAVRFTAPSYPATVTGGSIYCGDGSFPVGSSFIGQGFTAAVFASDGAGNMPGTLLDSVWVVATDTGWIHFEGLEAVIPSGDFYLAMIQGSNSPDCVPLGVDQTLPRAFKSYSRQVTAGEGWVVSPYQDLMIRAVISSPQGDMPVEKSPARFIIPQRVKGMISQNPPNAIPGYEAGAALMQPGTSGDNESVANYIIYRVANFDPLSGPQSGTLTLLSSNLSGNQLTESGLIWINLPEGWYAYAIQAVYNNGTVSEMTYSEAVPHKLFAEVNIDVKLLCDMASLEGAEVVLNGSDYPFAVYHGVTDVNGNALFHNLIEGQYTLQVSYPGYSTWVTNQQINNSSTIEVVLEDRKYAPRNLTADDMTLVAQWEPPLSVLLDENFEGTVFPPPGWQSTFQGSAGWFVTNDGAFGYWQIPDHTYYAMTNDGDAGNNSNGCCDLLITPVLNLRDADNYQLEFESYHLGDYGYSSTVEISFDAGQTWTVIYTPSPSNAWKHEIIDLSQYSGINGQDSVWIAFHGNDIGLMSLGWCVDDVRVSSGNIPYQGYAVFLDGTLVGETQLTSWTFNPTTINYGQTYVVGVAGKYCSGYSEQDTAIMTSHFLYPPRNLEVMPNMNAVILTWASPLAGDFAVAGSIPRTGLLNTEIDASPEITQRNSGDQPGAAWDVLLLFNAVSSVESAIVTDGNYFFTADWNDVNLHKYDLSGNWIEDFTIPGVSEIRDFARGEDVPFYATRNTGEILKLDLYNQSLLGVINTSLTELRHISYDPALDGGNGGFWAGSWSDEYLLKKDGTIIQQVASFSLSSCYGSAYDMMSPAGPYMWYFDQGGNGADIYMFDVTAMAFTGFVQDASTLPGFIPGSLAAGLECSYDFIPGKQVLSGSIQQGPNLFFIYELDGEIQPCCGLGKYRIFRNGEIIAEVSMNELEYWDTNLEPTTYCYEVAAVYDLTNYGFPGMEGESSHEGPECIEIAYGYTLPFIEEWTSASFALNQWVAGENWNIDGQNGNNAPSARFHWEPMLNNYSSSLESYYLNSTNLDTTVSHSIWLDFNLKLDDRAATSDEKLTAEVFNGNSWTQVAEFSSGGSFDWTRQHLNITNLSKNRVFKVRFTASGIHTADIHDWFVDSIYIYPVYLINPPLNLVAMRVGNPQNDVLLTWQPPMGSGVLLEYILDDNSAENGWSINPGYDAWLGNEFPVTDQGVLKQAKLYFQNNPTGSSQELTVEVFDSNRQWLGSSASFISVADAWITLDLPDIPFYGTIYAMVHWNMTAGNTHYLGSDENGPNAAGNYGWYFDGAAWSHLSDFGYAPNVFQVRLKALVYGDHKMLSSGRSMVQQRDAAMQGNALVQSHQSSKGEDISPFYLPNIKATVLNDLSYNVYRQQYTDPYWGGILTDWELIANVNQLEYLDLNKLINNCYFYKVTAVYPVGESVPSNVDWECYFDKTTESDKTSKNFYPNPASTMVTVKSTEAIHGYSILNSQGSCVEIREVAGLSEFEIDVSLLPAGLYTFRLLLDNGITHNQKILIIR